MPLVEVENVCRTYRMGRADVPVLRGVSMTVDKGECVAVLGASGSGKSTLLHLIGGLDRPDRPDRARMKIPKTPAIRFGGSDITAYSTRKLDEYRGRDVGFVFQFYHLLPELTILENVLLGAMILHGPGFVAQAGQHRARAEELLTAFGLGHRLKHRPSQLSGGERQRTAIARSLINQPALLLADEPTGNLDEQTGAKILDAMMELRARTSQTMIVVTHDPHTAERADRIVRLKDGLVIPA